MVEYLASARGADVNKGLRSSSLHYASCFGRAQIVKILLRYGADPELRDEEGKTPLDKARERDEDSHRDCVQILQQSSNQLLKDEELLSLVNSSVDISEQFSKSQETKLDFDNLPNKNNNYIDSVNKSNENQYLIISEHADNFRNQDQDNLTEIKLIYSKRLLPMLSKLYLTSCMIQSVNKSCLNLLRKLVNYCSKDQLHKNLTENSSISTMLVEVIGKILQEHEDEELSFDETDSSENDANISNNDDTISNYEAIYIALTMSQDLFNKCSSFILDEFTRFGVSNLIVQLTQTKLNINQTKCGKNMQLVDIKENCVYNWVTGNWAIIYSSDFLYIWQPFCVIELSHKSNGWFRFMLNNKLYIMFTDGKQEMISNTTNKEKSKSCEQFMNRFINAKDVALNTNAYTVLPLISQDPTLTPATSSSQSKQVENWIFQIESAECDNNNHQLSIKNNHSTTCLNLRTTLKGFDFVSNKNEIVQLIGYFHQGDQFDLPTFSAAAQNSNKTENLTNPASATFNKLSALHHYLALTTSKTAKLKLKQLKLSIFKLATRLNDDFLKPQVDSQNNRPRPIVIALISIIQQIKELYIKHEEDFSNSTEALSKLEQSFTDLKHLLVKNESSTSQNSLSSYEISVSGFVQILLTILSHSKCELKLNQRIQLFVRVFITEDYQQSIFLIRKLISLLESTEKLPLYLYDTGTYNLQAFSKRFKLTLKKGNPLKEEESPDNLLNFTGRVLKVEPLANISHLEKYITKMVVKQWHDYPRKDLHFLKKINESLGNNDIVEFRYENDFDENGLLYWIGTNGKTKPEWMNPIAASNLIRLNISESSRQQISSGKLEDMIGRSAVACHTNGEDKRVWIVIDLGVYIIPTHYTLRYSKGFTKTAPRNWALLASRNGGSNNEDWDLLSIHTNDDSLKDFGSSHTW
jgi:E3 ubiquitin-protein ligase HECTD1